MTGPSRFRLSLPIPLLWLGANERSTTTESAGLTLMGDRLYNAVTGRFTSLDPEPGGNPNAYTYPLDPINMLDLDGHWGWAKKAWRWAGRHKMDIALTALDPSCPAKSEEPRTLGYSPFWIVVMDSWRQGPWFHPVSSRNQWA